MAKFTLLELHLDDATLTANAPFSGESDGSGAETAPEPDSAAGDTRETGSGPPVVPLVVGLVVLLVAVAVLRRLIGGADREISGDESA